MDKSAVLEARRKRKQQKKERKQAAKRGRRGSRQKQGQTTHQKQAPEDLNQPTSDGPNADAGSEAHREKQRGDLGSAMGAAVEVRVLKIGLFRSSSLQCMLSDPTPTARGLTVS